jgi:hypothetical protein
LYYLKLSPQAQQHGYGVCAGELRLPPRVSNSIKQLRT